MFIIYFSFLGGYRIVYKKVPEFIVPDLAGFEVLNLTLKGAVSHTAHVRNEALHFETFANFFKFCS